MLLLAEVDSASKISLCISERDIYTTIRPVFSVVMFCSANLECVDFLLVLIVVCCCNKELTNEKSVLCYLLPGMCYSLM